MSESKKITMKHPKMINDTHIQDVEKFHQYLLQHHKRLLKDLPWKVEVVKRLKIGFDAKRQCIVFPIFDEAGDLVNIYWHKGTNATPIFQPGAPPKCLYPLPLIGKYPKDQLIYVEGPKDAVSCLSQEINCITHIGSATAIPDDLSPLKHFKHIILAFDNDDTGHQATLKLSRKLIQGE